VRENDNVPQGQERQLGVGGFEIVFENFGDVDHVNSLPYRRSRNRVGFGTGTRLAVVVIEFDGGDIIFAIVYRKIVGITFHFKGRGPMGPIIVIRGNP
jgi:hypothetical protein